VVGAFVLVNVDEFMIVGTPIVGLHHDGEQRLVDAAARSSSEGKNEPAGSLGIRNSASPAPVVTSRSRNPLR
jgi:hypothetical protein